MSLAGRQLVPLIFLIGISSTIAAQDTLQHSVQVDQIINLAGPRFGATLLTGKAAQMLEDNFDAAPIITQFGWQLEHRFFTVPGGPTGLTEFALFLGGMEQGLVLPSLTWLIGMRSPTGSEFGLGPNLSLSGAAYTLAFGSTTQYGALNVPTNLAFVFSKDGIRISVLVGFNARINLKESDWLW